MTVKDFDPGVNANLAKSLKQEALNRMADGRIAISTRADALEDLRDWADAQLLRLRSEDHAIKIISLLEDAIDSFEDGCEPCDPVDPITALGELI